MQFNMVAGSQLRKMRGRNAVRELVAILRMQYTSGDPYKKREEVAKRTMSDPKSGTV